MIFKNNSTMRIASIILIPMAFVVWKGWETAHPQLPTATATPAANIIYQSPDGGQSWDDISNGLPADVQVNAVNTRQGAIYLGSRNGVLYYSNDQQPISWQSEEIYDIFRQAAGLFPKQPVTGIFPGQTYMYAAVYESGIFRKAPGSHFWEPASEGLNEININDIMEMPDGSLIVCTHNGVFRSEKTGEWTPVFSKGWTSNLTQNGSTLIAFCEKGLLRSGDNGQHWEVVLPSKEIVYRVREMEGKWVAIRQNDPQNAAITPPMVQVSDDDGLTWAPLSELLLPAPEVYDLQSANGYWFCTHAAGISRSSDGGNTWELVLAHPTGDPMKRFQIVVTDHSLLAVLKWDGC